MERRKYVRVHKRMHMYFSYPERKKKIYGIMSKNISIGGCFLIFRKEIPIGTELNIDIDLDNGSRAEVVRAKVVRCEHLKDDIVGLGIEFTSISDDMVKNIEKYVETYKDLQPFTDIERYLIDNYIQELQNT